MTKEIILTKAGREKLENELDYLETTKRTEVGERIQVAREFGDISENSEYDDAKNEQAWVESRIAEITQILAVATVADVPRRSNKVAVGNKVTVLTQNGSEREFVIVGAAEADAANGRISNESPAGAAMLGAHRGDVITIEGPTGKEITYTIIGIGRQ
ncbi:MAG: transcription elongation factor GreA [Coriobacteriales bacterium]|jgi:transcription elongation factor GreA|nr:transcription elongation factor GreA [Coriobacteriales bacterium]